MENVTDKNIADQPEQVEVERVPVESPDMELANITREGDPDVMLAIMEKKAELAPRFKKARDTILASQTYPSDWKTFGSGDNETACLSSAGAERVATLFDIKFFECTSKKEKFTDSIGEGYRYVYQGKAAMGNRISFAQGIYSTRDKFLGYANQKFRPMEEINEKDIMQAAYHIFKGNAVKELLGLRGMPACEVRDIMGKIGKDPSKTKGYKHAEGTQGGTSQDDRAKGNELAELCYKYAAAGQFPVKDGKFYKLEWANEQQQSMDQMELAKAICIELSSFEGSGGKIVAGLGPKDLKGKRLEVTLSIARKLQETQNGN